MTYWLQLCICGSNMVKMVKFSQWSRTFRIGFSPTVMRGAALPRWCLDRPTVGTTTTSRTPRNLSPKLNEISLALACKSQMRCMLDHRASETLNQQLPIRELDRDRANSDVLATKWRSLFPTLGRCVGGAMDGLYAFAATEMVAPGGTLPQDSKALSSAQKAPWKPPKRNGLGIDIPGMFSSS